MPLGILVCMHNCGVRKKSPLHSVICDQQCPRRWTTDRQQIDQVEFEHYRSNMW